MRRWPIVATVTALTAVLAWAHAAPEPLAGDVVADHVVVHKATRTLELYRGQTLLRRYRVALGRSPRGAKTTAGDDRTPEGEYRLDYRNDASRFHRALHVSYPQAADRAQANARGVAPGELIIVHGLAAYAAPLGRLHRLLDWTHGCIAVTDHEIDEIARVVPVGTAITITP